MPEATPSVEAAASPEITRALLVRLRETGVFSAPVFAAALDFCGFVPGRKEWRDYIAHLLVFGGSLFLVAGVVFFIAWNWADMHRYVRLGVMASIVAGTGVGAVLRGPDTGVGRVLLLACGIMAGSMLAVFGQTYQTGAELWELFRVWTFVLLALAVAGKQAGLWFAAWLAGNVFVMLWFGRDMGSPLEVLGILSIVPEFVLALFCACAAWEFFAWKLRGREEWTWLQSRWLPRLLFFDLMARLTGYLCMVIFPNFWWHDLSEWRIPHWPALLILYLHVVGFSWVWHQRRTPDLFMPACILGSAGVLVLSLLGKAIFTFDADVAGFFVWGVLAVCLTAAIGRVLLVLHMRMERNAPGTAREERAAFFTTLRRPPAWEALRDHLHRTALQDLQAPLPAASLPASPWYVRSLLACGGWVAAVFFIVFTGLLLFDTLSIRSHEGAALLGASLVPLGIGFAALRLSGPFSRHFGFAMALAGTVCAGIGLGLEMNEIASPLFFALAALGVVLCMVLDSAAYRCIAAAGITCCVAMGLVMQGLGEFDGVNAFERFGGSEGAAPFSWLATVWWAFAGVGLAAFFLEEGRWRGTRAGKIAEPMAYGAFAGMMLYLIFALAQRFASLWYTNFFSASVAGVGLGAALGFAFFVWRRTRGGGHAAERAAVLGCALLALPVGWFLPGLGLTFLGLAVGRHRGSAVLQGATGAFLFVYMVYYYYFLGVSLLYKSLLLAGTGALLLGLAVALRRMYPESGEHSAYGDVGEVDLHA